MIFEADLDGISMADKINDRCRLNAWSAFAIFAGKFDVYGRVFKAKPESRIRSRFGQGFCRKRNSQSL